MAGQTRHLAHISAKWAIAWIHENAFAWLPSHGCHMLHLGQIHAAVLEGSHPCKTLVQPT